VMVSREHNHFACGRRRRERGGMIIDGTKSEDILGGR
jgi:hypothetical protein